MKKVIVLCSVLLLLASTAFAAGFAPQVMKITAPPTIKYDFDNQQLAIPVTVSGTPATATFCVYTKDKASSIKNVINGYLGWHHVNNVDTSIYISNPIQLAIGNNTIYWNGKDDDGNKVPAGSYTYYVFGYDGTNAKQMVQATIMNSGGSGGKLAHIQETDQNGKPLANPIWYSRGFGVKWRIGNDPMDSLLIETTSYPLPTGYSIAMTHSFEPGNFGNLFIRIGNNDTKTQEVRKYKWVPNGTSELITTWGEQGIVSWSSQSTGNVAGSVQPGTEIIGDYLWTGTNYYYDFDKASAPLTVIDWKSGSIEKVIDVADWWSDVNDKEKGQLNGGPNGLNQRNGMLYLNCHCSCIKQMVNPANMDDMDAFYVWTNQNGDWVLDHNYEPNSTKAWVCNDYKVGPYTYCISADANGFNMNPSYDCGAVSFGLLAPDGDGIGYFAYAGDTAGWKWFNIFVDNGGAFDGIYCDDNQRYTPPTGIAATVRGIYYVSHDSIKGVISNQVGVADAAPAVFAVSQNTPNPFNPTTTINFTLAKAGKVTIDVFNAAGQKVDTIANATMSAGSHSVNWNAAKFSAGVYFYTVNANGFSKTMKMTLLK